MSRYKYRYRYRIYIYTYIYIYIYIHVITTYHQYTQYAYIYTHLIDPNCMGLYKVVPPSYKLVFINPMNTIDSSPPNQPNSYWTYWHQLS